VSPTDAETLILLLAHFLALGVASLVFLWIIYLQRRNRAQESIPGSDRQANRPFPNPAQRPGTWLAVRSLEPEAIRAVLMDKHDFRISRRVNGWVIVTGPGLPNPSEDVDACHFFLTALSRELGHVQFFHIEKHSGHHAWARMDDGCVTRAYAWAGETIWNQGSRTPAENGLRMKCSGYGEDTEAATWAKREKAAVNVEKIPLLAARWSLDPEILHWVEGMTGKSSRLY